jgi:hypothetical protein
MRRSHQPGRPRALLICLLAVTGFFGSRTGRGEAPVSPPAGGAAAPDSACVPDKVITVGGRKQLFIDQVFFGRSEHVRLKVHPPRKTGEKTLEADRPWESASLNWFTVMEDEGRFRMWYECYDVDGWDRSDDTAFCYAESADGLRWSKPELGLLEYLAIRRTNILFRVIGPPGARSRVHGSLVFKDPAAKADQRYKAVSQGQFEKLGKPPHFVAGMVSADGLRWTRCADPICKVFADSQYSGFWDEDLRKYVLYGRVGGRGRSLGRSESTDFAHFNPLVLVLQSDDRDPPDSDLYNPAAMKYPYAANVYLMFPSLYQHRPDTLDIRLAVSRDGMNWTRPGQDTAFIALGGAGSFDSGSLYMGQGLLRVGNEIWQYYSGSPLKHAQGELEFMKHPGNRRVFSRVVSRLDGFVSAEAGTQVGYFVTPPLSFTGNRLRLNTDVRGGGYVRVGLLDTGGDAINGRSVTDCVPITGDHVDALVGWKDGPDVSTQAGGVVRLRVEMKDASLFAFQFGKAGR